MENLVENGNGIGGRLVVTVVLIFAVNALVEVCPAGINFRQCFSSFCWCSAAVIAIGVADERLVALHEE